jgi:dTDP-4-dehydrorhamnose 3,5-epimerase-like enzyme
MDLREILDGDIVRANHLSTYPDMVRAWYSHKGDYFLIMRGVAKIYAYDCL